MSFDSFMRKWATECQNNVALAIISLPFIVLISAVFAVVLFLRGDENWRKMV